MKIALYRSPESAEGEVPAASLPSLEPVELVSSTALISHFCLRHMLWPAELGDRQAPAAWRLKAEYCDWRLRSFSRNAGYLYRCEPGHGSSVKWPERRHQRVPVGCDQPDDRTG